MVLLRYAHHQVLHFPVDRGATGRFALLGAVKLLGDQFAVPAKNRVGLNDLGHFLQGLLPQLVANCGQRLAFAVTQPDAPFELVAEDTIFRDQILVA